MTTLLLFALLLADKPELSRCYSPYYPVAMGSEWEYRGETRAAAQGQTSINKYERRERVVALSKQSMRLQIATRFTSGDPSSTTNEYSCGDDGMVQDGYTISGSRMTFRGSETPLRSEPGAKWQSIMEVIDPSDGTGSRTITRFEIAGSETIVTPAGRFDALKVTWTQETLRVDPNEKRLAQYLRMSQDMEVSMKGVRWYAPQVGQVRSTFETITSLRGKQQSRVEGVEELASYRP